MASKRRYPSRSKSKSIILSNSSMAAKPHQERSAEPETPARRGQHLRRRVVVSRRDSAAPAGCVTFARRPATALSRGPGSVAGGRSPWAGLQSPITLTRTAKRDSFNCSTGFTGGKPNLAWSARPRSSAWSSRAAAATIARSVKSSAGVPAGCPGHLPPSRARRRTGRRRYSNFDTLLTYAQLFDRR